ncbi:MAG: flagellar hook protein, partial [Firmicutes bacterium]|nr:flagellar hook protein [Bacillota bacterium]
MNKKAAFFSGFFIFLPFGAAPQKASSDNGTYQDDTDREAIQLEVDALKSEIDRISTATEYNGMQLLDGSLAGASSANGNYGPRYGVQMAAANGDLSAGTVLTSSIVGVTVNITNTASGKGGENCSWDATGKTLTVNLANGESYNQTQLDKIISDYKVQKGSQAADVPDISLTLGNGVITAVNASSTTGATVAGQRAASEETDLKDILVAGAETNGHADKIKLTANSYGADARVITISFDVDAGKENVEVTKADTDKNTRDGEYTLHLASGTEYTENDIAKLLAKEGLDYSVALTDDTDPDGDVTLYANTIADVEVTIANGAGVFKSDIPGAGKGLTFQIGANGVEDQRVTLSVDDMSSAAIGVATADVSTQDKANEAIEMVDKAVKTVSMQRAALGAMQNRL